MAGNNRYRCYSFNITEQHCYWTLVQLITGSYFVEIQVLEITSIHLSVNMHLRHFFFSILLGRCNTRQTSLIKLHYKFHYKTKTVIPKLEISFEFGLAFYILLDTWLTFAICSLMLWESSFEAKLLNLRLKWLLRNLTLSLLSSFQVKMVNKGSDLVTFVIFSVVRKMKILQNLFKSWSSHNISNALLPMKLFTCPTIFYFIKNS